MNTLLRGMGALPAVALFVWGTLLCGAAVRGAAVPPTWANDANTLSAEWRFAGDGVAGGDDYDTLLADGEEIVGFTDGSLGAGLPDTSANGTALITSLTVNLPSGTGWRGTDKDLSGLDGAWDVGSGSEVTGRMDFSVVLASGYYEMVFQVDRGYFGMYLNPPELTGFDGQTGPAFVSDQYSYFIPGGAFGTYYLTTWEGDFQVTGSSIDFALVGDAERGAFVDNVYLWVRPTAEPVPEPGSAALLLLGSALVPCWRSRRRVCRRSSR